MNDPMIINCAISFGVGLLFGMAAIYGISCAILHVISIKKDSENFGLPEVNAYPPMPKVKPPRSSVHSNPQLHPDRPPPPARPPLSRKRWI